MKLQLCLLLKQRRARQEAEMQGVSEASDYFSGSLLKGLVCHENRNIFDVITLSFEIHIFFSFLVHVSERMSQSLKIYSFKSIAFSSLKLLLTKRGYIYLSLCFCCFVFQLMGDIYFIITMVTKMLFFFFSFSCSLANIQF